MDNEWWWRGVNLADWSREMLSEIRAIRRQHPHAKILLPLLAFSNNSAVRSGFDDSGTYRGSPAVAQINAAAPQIWALVDGFAVHPYSPGSPLSMHALDTVRRQLNQIPSARNKPFWITEMGWPTMGSPDAISEGEQAAWLADAIDELRGRSDVAAIMIYRLMDIAAPGASNDSESYYGIQRLDGSTKAAYRAVKARIR
jgi:exo-beta-1,3-glucanase (GH17 family)